MMNKNRSPMRKLVKYLSVLPLALLLIMANNVYAQKNETQQEPVKIEHENNKSNRTKSKYHEATENLDKLESIFKSELKYPQIAKENGIEGDVLVSFIVEEDGSVTNPKIIRATDPSFYTESIRVISSMPKLKQFTYIVDDEPLRIKYTGHFAFRLDGKKTSCKVRVGGYTILTIADKTGEDKPLFIVDGVKMGKAFDINSLNESDIEQKIIYQKEGAIATYGKEGKNGAVLITLKKTPINEKSKSDHVFVVVEKQPSFKEGVKAMMDFIESEMKYPIIAKENGIQGRVIVNFIVEKDGSISDVQIVRGVDPSLDKEAIRIIKAMPKWNPGIQRNERVRARYTLPISFKLDGNTNSSEITTAGVKILKDENEVDNEVIVRDYGSMDDKPIQSLAEKFGDGSPLIIVDDVKMEKGFELNSIMPSNIESITVLKDKSALEQYGEEAKNGAIIVTLKDKTKIAASEKKKEREDIFVVVEDQPQFPGGTEALMQYLGDNVNYPKEAHEKKIQGRVIANFVINKDGSISDVNIVRGVDPILDAEAIRVISEMPNWKPGMQRGQTVRVRYTLPIVFKLKADEEVESETMQKLKEKGPVTVVDMKNDDPEKAFHEFIGKNARYPVIAQENGIMGFVKASYDVNSNGEVSNIKIVEGVDPTLDKELKRIIEIMPKDIALMKSGGKAASNVEISALFRLQNGDTPPPPPVKSDVVVVGYGKPAE